MIHSYSRLFNSIYIPTQPKTVDLVKTNVPDPKPESRQLIFKEYTIRRPNGKVVHCRKLVRVNDNPIDKEKFDKTKEAVCNSCNKVHDNSWKWIDELDDKYKTFDDKRNDIIADIKSKYIVKTNMGRKRNQGLPYVYKSEEHRQQFLREVEQLGLVRKVDKIRSTVEITAKKDNPEYNSNRYQEDEL